MPHQCVRCNEFYSDGAKEILSGCSCGARLFFYIKKSKMEAMQKKAEQLTQEQKIQIEHDAKELAKQTEDPDRPVVLDIESIRINGPGKYELDLVQLFKGEPIVYRLEEGKYIVDVAESFEAVKRQRKLEGKN